MTGAVRVLRRLGGSLLSARPRDLQQLRCLSATGGTGEDGSAAAGTAASSASDAAKQNLEEWKARAAKEAKGRDPWEAFGSTNLDVRAESPLCWSCSC